MKGLATFLSVLNLILLIFGLTVFLKLEKRDQQEIIKLQERIGKLEAEITQQKQQLAVALSDQLPKAERITYRDNTFDTYRVDINQVDIGFYHKDERDTPLRSLGNLQTYLEDNQQKLLFATNAGMYTPTNDPQGLFIANGEQEFPIDLQNGKGNFYLKPNGVFLISSQGASIVESSKFRATNASVKVATQSGPLLIQQSQIHPAFREGSKNKYIRSGVGIVSNQEIVFAISNEPVNFYDFAKLFQEHFGCQDALYLDGAISQMYLPALERYDLGGNFGPMIAISESVLQ